MINSNIPINTLSSKKGFIIRFIRLYYLTFPSSFSFK